MGDHGGNAKLEWMYKTGKDQINREEYLTGRKVDKQFEELSAGNEGQNCVEHEVLPASISRRKDALEDKEQVDILRKQMEDPLMAIKQKEMDARRKILENPVRLKEMYKLLKEEKEQQYSSKSTSKKSKKKHRKSRSSSSSSEDLDKLLMEKYKNLNKPENQSDDDDDSNFIEKKFLTLKKELDRMVKGKTKESPPPRDSKKGKSGDSSPRHQRLSNEREDRNTGRMRRQSRDRQYPYSSKDYRQIADRQSRDKKVRVVSDHKRDTERKHRTSRNRRSSSREIRRRPASPTKQRRSRSPMNRRRSKSPVGRRWSKSPVNRKRSKSPVNRKRSKSPVNRKRSKSPVNRRRSKSPVNRRRSKSPVQRQRSRNHEKNSTRQSPVKKVSQKSPKKRSPSSDESPKPKRQFDDSDDERSYNKPKNYGLVTASGSKIALENKEAIRRYTREELKPVREAPKKSDVKRKKPLTEEKMNAIRDEMMQNASWREKDREIKVKRHRESEEKEKTKHQESFDKDFLQRQLKKAQDQVGSVESRIRSNLNNIQRSGRTMDTNFAKR